MPWIPWEYNNLSAGANSWETGYDFSYFDMDGDGYVELPLLETPEAIQALKDGSNTYIIGGTTYSFVEYTEPHVQRHTIIHEIGHALGVVGHPDNPNCVLHKDSVDWDRAGYFGGTARQRLFVNNN